jgi:hypothetical protein
MPNFPLNTVQWTQHRLSRHRAVAEQIWLGKGREGLELEYAGIR